MTEAVWVSMVILWCVVIVLAIVVVALARQVGILHERVAPAGALMPTNGPKVGELTEAKTYAGLDGNAVTVGGANGAGVATLVLWVSPTCPVCKSLVPTAVSLSKAVASVVASWSSRFRAASRTAVQAASGASAPADGHRGTDARKDARQPIAASFRMGPAYRVKRMDATARRKMATDQDLRISLPSLSKKTVSDRIMSTVFPSEASGRRTRSSS